MNCEKCGNELTRGSAICRECGHNQALAGLQKWRTQREEVINGKAETNLIPFPKPPKRVADRAETPPPQPPIDDWRKHTKERVRRYVEQRTLIDQPAGKPAVTPPPNVEKRTILEGALSRIRRVQAPPPPTATDRPPRQANRPAASPTGLTVVRLTDREPAAGSGSDSDYDAPPPSVPRSPNFTPPAGKLVAPDFSAPRIERAIERTHAPDTFAPDDETPEPPAMDDAPMSDREAPALRPPPTLKVAPKPAPRSAPKSAPKSAEDEADEAADEDDEDAAPASPGRSAPLWKRLLAGIIDMQIVAVCFLPIFLLYVSWISPLTLGSLPVLVCLFILAIFVYQLLLLLFVGRTWGMAAFDLHVINRTDEQLPLTIRQTLRRAVGGTLALLCPPVTLLLTQFTAQHQGLADLLSGTITVRQ